jgi:hypothetical protein
MVCAGTLSLKEPLVLNQGQQYKKLKTIAFAEERERLAIGSAELGVYRVDILSKFNYPLLPG